MIRAIIPAIVGLSSVKLILASGVFIAASTYFVPEANAKIYSETLQNHFGNDVKVWAVVCTDRIGTGNIDPVYTKKGQTLTDAYNLGLSHCGEGNFSAPPDVDSPGFLLRAEKARKIKFVPGSVKTGYSTISKISAPNYKPVVNQQTIRVLPNPNKANLGIIYGNGDYKSIRVGKNDLYKIKCTNIDFDFFMDGASTKEQVQSEIDKTCQVPE